MLRHRGLLGPSSPARARFVEIARFGTVGAAQNLLNVGLFAVGVALGLPYLLAAIISGAVALAASFVANRRWTFQDAGGRIGRQAATYTAVFVAASLGALVVLAFFAEVAEFPKVLAQALSLAIMAPLSYLAQRLLTFRAARS